MAMVGQSGDTGCANQYCYRENCYREICGDGKYRCNAGRGEKIANYVLTTGLMSTMTAFCAYKTAEYSMEAKTSIEMGVCAAGVATTIFLGCLTVVLEKLSRPGY